MSASMNLLISRISRITLNSIVQRQSFHTQNSPLLFKASEQLSAMPLKKKRKSDPNYTKKKADKLKKKFDKELKRIDRMGRPLKPIDEFEDWRRLYKMQSTRKRGRSLLSREELEERVVILKNWSRYKNVQNKKDGKILHMLMMSQEKALEELRSESEELYQKAIEIDENMFDMVLKGPYATPPIPDYMSPDGEYVDISRTDFDSPYTDPVKQFQATLKRNKK